MDVAVCISGEFRNNVDLCRESIQKYLPYKQFTHTWADTPLPELPSMETFVLAFNTWIACLPEDNTTRTWFTKKLKGGKLFHQRVYQVYNHWHCMQQVPKNYDMIIRVRPDVVLYEHAWERDIENAYFNDFVIGFGSGQGPSVGVTERYAADHVIIHRRYRMRNPYKTLLPSSGHVAWWVCLHKYLDEQFINNDSVCKLERNIVD
tara:strand:- start:1241 stop:1855 length:615 start_codon:yes stop_codon:yes gene_type:complete